MLPIELKDCLSDTPGSYMLPFLWYTGQDKVTVFEQLEAIKAAGMNEVVYENRGGDWFCTEPWFEMFGSMLEKARSLNMRVWMLDDAHVNTGSANDSLRKEENAQFRPQNLRLVPVDVTGPISAGALVIPKHTDNEKVVAVSLYRRDEISGHCVGKPIDLTSTVVDGLYPLELPEGLWRAEFVFTVDPAKQGLFAYYITMLSRESCRHLIDEVHEKIYARFSKYFGNTFAGFFSDEPAFGNCDGKYGYDFCDHRMGQLQIQRFYPWWSDMPHRLAEKSGIPEQDIMCYIPALWDEIDNISPMLRTAYMDIITELWQENFSGQLGQWCREHNIMYIGHNLEDNSAHMHTGWGCGHFFRSMSGQDMAGTDVVLNQMLPGVTDLPHSANCGSQISNSRFYQYTLQKLGASLAHITPLMQSKAVCEIMGGYGWAAGLPVIKSILDHCLSNGINHFIPHAYSMETPKVFSKKELEETENSGNLPPGYCPDYMPPTFFCGGFNPQYKVFGDLMRYGQRVCHLLADGIHQPDVAVYYNAEADWINCPMRHLDEMTAQLTHAGFDFDILPADTVYGCSVSNGGIKVNQEMFRALVVPYAERYPYKLLARFAEIANQGGRIIFSDALPSGCDLPDMDIEPFNCKFTAVDFEKLPEYLLEKCGKNFKTSTAEPQLRHYGLKKNNGELFYFLHNEGRKVIDTRFELMENVKSCAVYEPWNNALYRTECRNGSIRLRLEAQQFLVFIFNIDCDELPLFIYDPPEYTLLDLRYDISIKETGEKEFQMLRKNSEPVNLTIAEKLTRCCAEFAYDAQFECSTSGITTLVIPEAGDCAELWINGVYCGSAIGSVCRFDVSGTVKKGKNTIRIVTADNPAYADRASGSPGGIFGGNLPLVKHGFTGKIMIG